MRGLLFDSAGLGPRGAPGTGRLQLFFFLFFVVVEEVVLVVVVEEVVVLLVVEEVVVLVVVGEVVLLIVVQNVVVLELLLLGEAEVRGVVVRLCRLCLVGRGAEGQEGLFQERGHVILRRCSPRWPRARLGSGGSPGGLRGLSGESAFVGPAQTGGYTIGPLRFVNGRPRRFRPRQTRRSLAIVTRADESAATRWHAAAAFAAWVVPGLGHYLLGQRARGAILAVSIGGLWFAGLLIGGVDSLDKDDHPAWFLGQMLVAPSVAVSYWYLPVYLEQGREPRPQIEPPDPAPAYVPSFARANEQGVLYTALAGMLNLLAIIDVLYRDPADPRHRHVTANGLRGHATPGNAPAPETAAGAAAEAVA